jgi:Fe-S-cluster formation regulator IscX/YfhJ
VKWIDAEDLGIALYEKFPVLTRSRSGSPISREKSWTRRLEDDPKASNEPKLEAIQMAWYEEWKENQ